MSLTVPTEEDVNTGVTGVEDEPDEGTEIDACNFFYILHFMSVRLSIRQGRYYEWSGLEPKICGPAFFP